MLSLTSCVTLPKFQKLTDEVNALKNNISIEAEGDPITTWILAIGLVFMYPIARLIRKRFTQWK
jgi:hypothetical protein